MRRTLIGLMGAAWMVSASIAAAQTATLKVASATPGMNIDLFIDAGKVGIVIVDPKGEGAFDLDLLSLGKPTGQLYIETCKDGQRVRIVTDGTIVPTEEGCNRKPIGVLFTFTCTKRITLNFAAAKASFGGCGSMWTNEWVWVAIGGVASTVAVTAGGGGSSSVAPAAVTPPVVAAPAATNTTPTLTPTPAAPAPAPGPATIDAGGAYDVGICTVVFDPASHNNVLRLCELVRQILASASNGGVTFTANAPWVTIGGTYNTTTGEFNLSTTGVVAGFSNVSVTLRGNVTAAGVFVGELTMGANGVLPGGQPVRYEFRAQKR